MNEKTIYKGPALISFLVKKLNQKFPEKQIGKTLIQKLIFILSIEANDEYTFKKYNYNLHYYGPYSSDLSLDLDFAENLSFLNVQWNQLGYHIFANKSKDFERYLGSSERGKIGTIIDKYGSLNAKELSILATALYFKDNYNLNRENLVKSVKRIKTEYSEEEIRSILTKFL